jgi:hypothetical protein
VSGVTVTRSLAVTNAPSDYTVTFVTSASGAMAGGAGNTLTATFPNGFGLANAFEQLTVGQPGANGAVGKCADAGASTISCSVTGTIGAGVTVTLTISRVTNPPTPSTGDTISIETTADNGGAVASNTFAVLAAQSVSGVTATQTNPTAGATSNYTVTFMTSSTGAMPFDNNIELAFPNGTGLFALTASNVTAAGQTVGRCDGSTPSTIGCSTSAAITANERVSVTLDGVINPSTASTGDTVGVETTADNAAIVSSNAYSIVAPQAVSGVTVAQSSPVTSAGSNYTVTFVTSSTGAMPIGAGDAITLTFPSGTGLNSLSSVVTDTTKSEIVGRSCTNSSTATLTCGVNQGVAPVAAGDTVSVALTGVVNPSSPSTGDSVGVETTPDDAGLVASNTYAITAAQKVSNVNVALSSLVVNATSNYTVTFVASSTGAMASGAGDAISVLFSSGTNLNALGATSVTDVTNGEALGACSRSTQSAIACVVGNGSNAIADGDTVTVRVGGVINPNAPGTYTVSVLTSVDSAAQVPSNPFVLVGPPNVTAVSPGSGPAGGGNTVTVLGSSLQGASQVLFGTAPASGVTVNASGTQLTAVAPAGPGPLPSTVDITVVTPFGTSTHSTADRYEYLPVPVISSVSPTSGSAGGGTTVTITGTGFLGGQIAAAFGTSNATVEMVNAAGTQMTVATPPAASTGAVAVSVTTNGGTGSKAGAYTYTRAVTHTSLQASPGNVSYGQSVTLTATVTPSPVGGTVRFTLNGVQLGSPVAVSGGVARLAVALPAGSHTPEAHYSGTEAFDASNGSVTIAVARAATAIGAQPAALAAGSATMHATLTSSVTGADVAGASLVFKAGSTILCSVKTASDGSAACTATTASKLAALQKAGGYAVSFAGTTDYAPSSTTAGLGG